MPGADLPLFRAFPALAQVLPRHALLAGPTPVERLPLLGAPDGVVYVKRDDRSCPLYGGNKPRKLEFLLGRALARGTRRLVTTGGLGTNHGLAMTIVGRAAGLAATLVLVDQPATAGVRATLCLQHAYGATQIAARNVAGAVVRTTQVLAASAARGECPQLVATGGSSSLGDVGFVSAAFELAEQVRTGVVPAPETIVLPIGSGGSMAGLVLGLRLAGLQSRVLGVLVTDILSPTPFRLWLAARGVLRLLRRADPGVPIVALRRSDFVVARDQLGPGYGVPTPAADAAVASVARSGLVLDTTYSAKAFAWLATRASKGALGAGPVLFWHTYNAVDVAAAAPRRVVEADLPPAIRRALVRAAR